MGPFTVGAGSTISAFHAYLRSSGAGAADPAFRPLIYEDSAGEPGALIATLAEIVVPLADTTGAWRDLTGLSVVSTSDAIWIGLWYNGVNHRYAYDTPGGDVSRYKSSLATYSSSGDAPDPWPAGSDATDTQEHSTYIEYTASGQQLRPDADVTTTGWTTTPLWSKIEETSADGTVITATAS